MAIKTKLTSEGRTFALKNTVRRFSTEHGIDQAAALTYYSVLAMVPALIAILSLVGVVGESDDTVDALISVVRDIAPGSTADAITPFVRSLAESRGSGLALILGLITSLWSASAYVSAFSRQVNNVYQVREGRPIWILRAQLLLLTLILVLLAVLVLLSISLGGSVLTAIAGFFGVSDAVLAIWRWAKWPLILVVVAIMNSLLYRYSPNIKMPFSLLPSAGSWVSLFLWGIASAGFGIYVTNFSSYGQTYGALATVVILLLWIWITNIALMLGVYLDAEFERAKELEQGLHAEDELKVPLKSYKQVDKIDKKQQKFMHEASDIRRHAGRAPKPTKVHRQTKPSRTDYDEDGFSVSRED